MGRLLKAVFLVASLFLLSLSSEGGELLSIQLGTFKTERGANGFLNRLPLNLKLFIYKTKGFYTVREGLFQKREEADRERRKLRNRVGIDGIVVKTNPEKLLYLFYNEDYEEFLSLFSGLNIEKLSTDVIYAIGVSYLNLGKLKKAEKFLSTALKRGEKKSILELTKVYYAEGNYKKVVSLYESSKEKLPDSILYYVATSYLKLGNRERTKELLGKIKVRSIREKILMGKTYLKTDLSYGYDSNIYLIPEDVPLERRSRSDNFEKFSLFVKNSNLFRNCSFWIFGKRFENRHNSDLDIAILELEREENLSKFKLVLPSISYIYTMNSNYSLTLKSGIRKRFPSLFLSFLLGFERNFITRDRDNFLTEGFALYKGFRVFLIYRNYRNTNDKFYITLSRNFGLNFSENLSFSILPKVKFTKYMGSTDSVRPGITGKLSLKVKGGEVYLRGGYERNYAHNEKFEWDYKRHFIELGIDYSF